MDSMVGAAEGSSRAPRAPGQDRAGQGSSSSILRQAFKDINSLLRHPLVQHH
jgi:hypothetical protein